MQHSQYSEIQALEAEQQQLQLLKQKRERMQKFQEEYVRKDKIIQELYQDNLRLNEHLKKLEGIEAKYRHEKEQNEELFYSIKKLQKEAGSKVEVLNSLLLENEKQFLEQIQAQKLQENDLKDQNIQLKYEAEQLSDQLSRLAKQAEGDQDKYQSQQVLLNELVKNEAKLKSDLQEKQSLLDQHQSRMGEDQKQIDILRYELKIQQKQLYATQKSKQHLGQQLEQAGTQFMQLDKANKQLRIENKQLQQQIGQMLEKQEKEKKYKQHIEKMKHSLNHEKQKELEKMNTLFDTFALEGEVLRHDYINKREGFMNKIDSK